METTATNTVILSDQKPFEVPILGIFELDNERPEFVGPFTYKLKILGKEYDAIYDIDAWGDKPPQKPECRREECVEGDTDWYQWNDYLLYEQALAHEQRREQQIRRFIEKIAHYILNKCVDTHRIVTAEDWVRVYQAAMVPQLTIDVLVDTLQKTYQAEYDGADLFTALSNMDSDNPGSYNTLRQWENELMVKMRLTEIEYARIPLAERARKVCSLFLPDIMSVLEQHRLMRKNAKNTSKT